VRDKPACGVDDPALGRRSTAAALDQAPRRHDRTVAGHERTHEMGDNIGRRIALAVPEGRMHGARHGRAHDDGHKASVDDAGWVVEPAIEARGERRHAVAHGAQIKVERLADRRSRCAGAHPLAKLREARRLAVWIAGRHGWRTADATFATARRTSGPEFVGLRSIFGIATTYSQYQKHTDKIIVGAHLQPTSIRII